MTNGKIDLKDTTFCIPIYVDSIFRKQNVELTIKYLKNYFDTNIIIAESYSISPRLKNLGSEVKYLSYKNTEKYFHKTKLLNMMYLESDTPYLISYDCDALFPVKQLEECINLLRHGVFDACFPFKDYTINIPRELYEELFNTLNLDNLKKPDKIKEEDWKNNYRSRGLALAMKEDLIVKIGFENENFKSWGPENEERLHKIKFVGGRLGNVNGYSYHLEHFRGVESTDKHGNFKNNVNEFKKVKTFKTQKDLFEYYKTFDWYNKLVEEYKKKKSKKIINDIEFVINEEKKNKIDFFQKVTFIIPFHYDTNDRLENINISLDYLYKNVIAKIIVGEMDKTKCFQYELHRNKSHFDYHFYKEDIFTKTKLINNLVKEVDTEFFCLHDTDIFLTIEQFKETRIYIDCPLIDTIIPYNGLYLEIPRKFKEKVKMTKNIKDLDSYCSYRFLKEHYMGTGACVFFRKSEFIDSGMMNQFFKKWGLEDDEIIHRMSALGKNVFRLKFADPIHHLVHEINHNEFGYMEHELTQKQKEEYIKIKSMDFGGIREYSNNLFKENM